MRTISPFSIAALRALFVDFLRRGLPATPLTRPGFAPSVFLRRCIGMYSNPQRWITGYVCNRLIVLEEVYYG